MKSTRLSFDSFSGVKLAARLDRPDFGKPGAYALFAHCFTCSKDLKAVGNISRALTGREIAVLRFDFTGLGQSGGDFADTTFSSNVDDLAAAAEFMAFHYRPPRILIGHSLGGAAVLQAAVDIPSAVAVVTLGAPADPRHLRRHLAPVEDQIRARGEAQITIDGRSFRIRRRFLEDLERPRMQATIRNLNRALLVMHAPLDGIVDIENAARIFSAARHPKSFVSLDRADHLLSREADSRYAGEVIAAWSGRYLRQAQGSGA